MRRPRSVLGAALLLVLASVAAAPWLARAGRSRARRVAVEGHSMAPTLAAGDWLLVDRLAYRERPPAPGELVVAVDPRAPERWIVKRVAEVLPDGGLALAGDHPAHGAVASELITPRDALIGRPWLRYWPLGRLALLGEALRDRPDDGRWS